MVHVEQTGDPIVPREAVGTLIAVGAPVTSLDIDPYGPIAGGTTPNISRTIEANAQCRGIETDMLAPVTDPDTIVRPRVYTIITPTAVTTYRVVTTRLT